MKLKAWNLNLLWLLKSISVWMSVYAKFAWIINPYAIFNGLQYRPGFISYSFNLKQLYQKWTQGPISVYQV